MEDRDPSLFTHPAHPELRPLTSSIGAHELEKI